MNEEDIIQSPPMDILPSAAADWQSHLRRLERSGRNNTLLLSPIRNKASKDDRYDSSATIIRKAEGPTNLRFDQILPDQLRSYIVSEAREVEAIDCEKGIVRSSLQ